MSFMTNDLFGESGLSLEESQKERKEYVKNIGIEYRYGCYEEKRADSCHLLADYREAIELNFKSAFRLYQENCEERNYPKSCFKACDLGDGEACWTLSTWYMGPNAKFKEKDLRKGVLERDIEKSIEYGIRACDNNVFQSCANISRIYKIGDGVPKDLNKAKEYKERAEEIVDNIKKGLSPNFTA